MRQLRFFSKTCLLILLLGINLPGYAQEKNGSKRKLAAAPGILPIAPNMVRPTASINPKGRTNNLKIGSKNTALLKAAYPSSAMERGFYFKQQGRLDEALLEFIRAAQENPRDVRAFYEQAQIFKSKGKIKFAKSALEQALAVSPGNTQARSLLVQLHFESGNLMGAAAEVGKFFGLNQSPAPKAKPSADSTYISAPSAAIQIASGKLPLPTNSDASSAWLQNASSTGQQASPMLDDIMSQIGGSGEPQKSEPVKSVLLKSEPAVQQRKDEKTQSVPSTVSQILNEIPSFPLSQKTLEVAAQPEPAKMEAVGQAPDKPASPNSQSNSIISRTSSMFSWAREKIPLGRQLNPANQIKAAEENNDVKEEKQSRREALISWVKEKTNVATGYFTAKTNESPKPEPGKAVEKDKGFLDWVREKANLALNSKSASSNAEAARAEHDRVEAARSEARKLELSKVEAKREEQARIKADRIEAKKAEQARIETARIEAKKAEQARIETARIEAKKAEQARIETARIEAKKAEQARVETARIEAKKAEQARIETARVEANKAERDRIARIDAEKAERAKTAHKQNKGCEANNSGGLLAWFRNSTPFTSEQKTSPSNGDNANRLSSLFKSMNERIAWKGLTPRPQRIAKPQVKPVEKVASADKKQQSNDPHLVITGSQADGEKKSELSPELQKMALKTLEENNKLDKKKSKDKNNKQVVFNTTAPETNAEKNNLPPELAKALDGKFAADAVITAQTGQAESAERKAQKEEDEKLKQVLASVPSKETPKETERPELSGPKYGLLKNNALSHVGASNPPDLPEPAPSFINNLIKQAGKTFAGMLPSIDWNWPTLPSLGEQKKQTAAEVVANVPAIAEDPKLSQAPAPTPKPPVAVPLDVSRILNKLSGISPSAPVLSASNPIAPSLSATIPLAANPINVDAVIPKPIASAVPAPQAALPTINPQTLTPSTSAGLVPKTTPQTAPQQNVMQASLPPFVQEAIDKAQPIIKPAFEAANNLVHNIAPLLIPPSASPTTQPVQPGAVQSVPNNVPTPVGKDTSKYYQELAKYYQAMASAEAEKHPEELVAEAAAPARKLIDVQQGKSGAFTYMKPVIDSDRAYLLGAKQVRTIQPLPGKPQQAKAAVQEDPITKRMRYLLEHGTGNLRKGEAFMFSEETGEGTLFLPDGSSERRKLQEPQDAEKVLRNRRPDIVNPKDLQYSLSLLGKLLPPQQNREPNNQPVSGPTLDQLINQMNQNSKGLWGWMKKSFGLN